MHFAKTLIILLVIKTCFLQAQVSVLSTEAWLKDATTISFGDPSKRTHARNSFNGIRLIFEPQVGKVIQIGVNRFEHSIFSGLDNFGFESNLFKGYLALQILTIFPSMIQFDERNPIRMNEYTIDPNGRVAVDFGVVLGLSFFDGIIAIGYGKLFYAKRDFWADANMSERDFRDEFIYINIQTISAVKAVLKNF